MAEGATVANAYVQIMPSAQGAKQSITDAILPAAVSAGDEAGDAIGKGILGKIGELKGPLVAIGGTVLGALGVAKITGALMDIGGEFDAMRDTIVIGTGASGEALDALCASAETIATTVPVSFEEAGNIVQDVNTRMGLVGDELEGVGNRVAALGELTGKAINLDTLTGSLNAFGVAGEDAAGKMDYLWGVSQNTGIGFDKLTGILEANAPALQSLGFSMESAANMAGLLDKAGLDASGTMGKMGKALVSLAQPGESAEDAFQRVVGQLGEYIEAGDEAAALDLASEVFGTKGATQFVAAVKSGAVSLDELADSALGAGDGIMGTLEATMDWPERMELMKNSAKQALEPLGGALMDAATTATEKLSEVMSQVDPAVFTKLGEILGTVLVTAIDVLAKALQFLVDHKAQIAAFFAGIKAAVQTVIDILGPLVKKFLEVASEIPAAVSTMRASLAATWDSIKSKVTATWDGIKSKITDTWNGVKTTVSGAVDGIKSTLSGAWDSIKSKVTATWDGIKSKITDTWNGVKTTVSGAVDGIKSTLSGAWDSIKSKVTATWESIKGAITKPIESARDAVSNAVQRIKDIFNTTISFPHIKVPHFYISGGEIPWGIGGKGTAPSISIDWYAEGGWVDRPTVLAGVGERGGEFVWPSYEPYMSKYADALSVAIAKRNGGAEHNVTVTGNTFIVRKESDIAAIGRAINDDARRREWARL